MSIKVTEVDLWLHDIQYDEHKEYFKSRGATTLVALKEFFMLLELDDLYKEYPELSKLVLFTVRKGLESLKDADIKEYTIKASTAKSISPSTK